MTCSCTDRVLVTVTPRIFMTSTRLILAREGGCWKQSFRRLSVNTISWDLAQLRDKLLACVHKWQNADRMMVWAHLWIVVAALTWFMVAVVLTCFSAMLVNIMQPRKLISTFCLSLHTVFLVHGWINAATPCNDWFVAGNGYCLFNIVKHGSGLVVKLLSIWCDCKCLRLLMLSERGWEAWYMSYAAADWSLHVCDWRG